MNVWILSVRELTRLLRGRLTWLAAALTVLSPLAGLTVYRSASADTMQSLYVANPALAGGVLGGLLFALLTLCDCARTSRCRVEVRSRPGRGPAVILYLPLVENVEEFEE